MGSRGRGLVVWSLCLVLTLLGAAPAAAHEPGTSAVLVDITETRVVARLQLPIDRLAVALGGPLDADTVIDRHGPLIRDYIGDHVAAIGTDGSPWQATVGPIAIETVDDADHLTTSIDLQPPGGRIVDFVLHYDVILEELLSHDILVTTSIDGGDVVVVATLDHRSSQVTIAVGPRQTAGPNNGMGPMIRYGFDHVLEGPDHLLFLLVLLLPAPSAMGGGRRQKALTVARRNLRRVAEVATAFTIGHGLTLVLAARTGLRVPSTPVEVLVALSVAVAALHAYRPLVRHGEAAIAVGFGLVHGLAFAGLLDQLGLANTSWTVLAGFNLGVELAQLATIGLVYPLFHAMSLTTRYPTVRLVLVAGAAITALGWIVDRIGFAQSPLGRVETFTVEHPLAVVSGLMLLAIGLVVADRRGNDLAPIVDQPDRSTIS